MIPPENMALIAFKEGEHCEKTLSFYKNRYKFLRLKASAEHTQYENLRGERIIINPNNFFDF